MILLLILLSILSLVPGILLTLKGNPYGKFFSAIHKLFSFIAGVIFCIIIYKHFNQYGWQFLSLILPLITLLFFIASVITGSILISVDTTAKKLKLIHRVTSFATYLFAVISLYSL